MNHVNSGSMFATTGRVHTTTSRVYTTIVRVPATVDRMSEKIFAEYHTCSRLIEPYLVCWTCFTDGSDMFDDPRLDNLS
jgi:hypothetical protein